MLPLPDLVPRNPALFEALLFAHHLLARLLIAAIPASGGRRVARSSAPRRDLPPHVAFAEVIRCAPCCSPLS
jgi:hypothetical protein